MTMDFQYDGYGSLEHIMFQGLNGCEFAGNLKSALELLKIENPMCSFQERVKAGEFDNMPDDEYNQIVSAVQFAATLWCYPDAQVGELAQSEMNVLMLLANAIKVASKQNAAIKRHNAARRGIISKKR